MTGVWIAEKIGGEDIHIFGLASGSASQKDLH